MTTILCPTRGGRASIPNQERAIAIAKERAGEVLFLYVSNVHFLNRLASPVLVDVQEELDELGEFMLTMAQERAQKAGVRARTAIRSGIFRTALRELIQEQDIAAVVLGTPAEAGGITTPDYRADLIDWILTETGVDVIVTHAGEIVAHYKSQEKA